ncbi:DUF3284 domain-containing protein [Vagococcus carniphilus]|uniref:DUF3284 domain-containing protein n=1 Tax=Vagococcus carniphilus TaxID=218144 RepID=UPI00288F52D4|nr:DUF3284 domain-containing protein [Vagococcus carniphilus]MDT2813687.1 DUF3284 domain-containing protein [Vagococcus carniphilus]
MKISKELNIPAAYFYHKLVESVLHDVSKSTGEVINESNLENCEYVKEFPGKQYAKIKINQLVPNQSYSYSTSTTKNDFTASYKIESLSDTMCVVAYEEEMISHGTLQKINDSLFRFILGKFKKKRFMKMLEQVESSY